MNITMWVVGGVIFAIYMYFTIWNINTVSKKEVKVDTSYDEMDMDGMGNFSRFPETKKVDVRKRKNISRKVYVK